MTRASGPEATQPMPRAMVSADLQEMNPAVCHCRMQNEPIGLLQEPATVLGHQTQLELICPQ